MSRLNEQIDGADDTHISVNRTPVPSSKMAEKHMFMMVLCCAIPLIAVAVLWYIGIGDKYLIYVVMLLCPILHLVMMRGMHGGTEK
ncbi:MAG: DUF2933 domain-containing protein [ANME-2 cluster archaeon]|nr:DUF2933 domain-containing protein [ANME-2 cluster archaeon]